MMEKRKLFMALLLAVGSLTVGAQSKYDLNSDGKVDAADVVELVNAIMAGETTQEDPVTNGEPPAGVEAVDLGLPSGRKWANMNVGAQKPEGYGLFFAWGETTGYTSDISDGHSFDWAHYKWCNGSSNTMTKYCTDSSYGTVDGNTTLALEDDAAYINWGSNWRMPTYDDIRELLNNTTNEWTTLNGISGCKFTSKTNGNSIFLPAAGYRGSSDLYNQATYGGYWSSSLDGSYSDYARYLYFYSEFADTFDYGNRYVGFSVRPVLRN